MAFGLAVLGDTGYGKNVRNHVAGSTGTEYNNSMSNQSAPYFDATFPSFLRKVAHPKREAKKLVRRRAPRTTRAEDLKEAGLAFFRKSLLVGR